MARGETWVEEAANSCLSRLVSLEASCAPWAVYGVQQLGLLEPVPSPPYYSSLHFSKDTNPRNPPTSQTLEELAKCPEQGRL